MDLAEDLNDLVRLSKSQAKVAGRMLARTFINEPYEVYLTPDENKRKKRLVHLYTYVMKFAILYGEAYATSPKLEGVAGWLPPGALGSVWKTIRSGGIGLLFRIGLSHTRKELALIDLFQEEERRHAPFLHWYLTLIGVDPEFQGQGYASKLMRPMLARLDQERVPSYLETELKETVLLYEHFGFEVVKSGTILDTDVPYWCMIRKPSESGKQ